MTDKNIHEEIRREHEELRELLGNIHHTLAKRLETVAGVSAMMASFCQHIEAHFTDEETAGFFDEIMSAAPRYTERTEELCAEHVRLLDAVRKLEQAAQGGDGSSDWWQRLDSEFHQFSTDLMHHESKENELLQDVYSEDIGSQD